MVLSSNKTKCYCKKSCCVVVDCIESFFIWGCWLIYKNKSFGMLVDVNVLHHPHPCVASNLTTKITKLPLKSMVNFIFLKIAMVKQTVWNFTHSFKWGHEYFLHGNRLFEESNLLLKILCKFIRFKVSLNLPESFHGLLNHKNILQLAYWTLKQAEHVSV